MRLKKIQLKNFRNYPQREFRFQPGLTLVVGPNTSGKTNLLEAIYLLATGKSLRASREQEMIRSGQEITRVKGQAEEELEIVLTKGEIRGERVPKKQFLLNGVRKRKIDFVGQLPGVFFEPEDLALVIGSPSGRRHYLDAVLEPIDREYRRASLSYQKGLRQRNRLLEQIRDRGRPKSTLFFWNKLLLENGDIISRKREAFLDFVNAQPGHFGELTLVYQPNRLSPARLDQYQPREIAAGMTLIGPHRDGFVIGLRNHGAGVRDLHLYGSRGEQRTAVFSLKLAELEFVTETIGQRPLLLLDDIFSELDKKRRAKTLAVIPQQQTIITATDLASVDQAHRKKMIVIKL